MLMIVTLIVIFTSLWFLYIKFIRTSDFWKQKNIASAISVPVFGNIKDFILGKRHLIYIYDDIYNEFHSSQFVGIFEMRSPNLLILDAELANRILIKDFSYFYDRGGDVDEDLDPLNAHLVNLCGSRWRNTRNRLLPAFSSGKLKQMFGLIEDCVDELEKHVLPFVESGEPVDVRDVMAKFATDVIGRCALGLECNAMKDPNSEFRAIGRRIFKFTFKLVIRVCLKLINPNLLKLFPIKAVPVDIEIFFFSLLNEAMSLRKSAQERRVDFLQLMIDIREQEKQVNSKDGE